MLRVILILTLLFLNGCNMESDKENSKERVFIYTFSNPSLGPVNGVQKVELVLKGNNIISAKDLANNKQITLKEIKGINFFQKALKHKNSGLKVSYLSSDIPKKIVKKDLKGQIGGGFTITVVKK